MPTSPWAIYSSLHHDLWHHNPTESANHKPHRPTSTGRDQLVQTMTMNIVNMQEYANMKHVVNEYHYSGSVGMRTSSCIRCKGSQATLSIWPGPNISCTVGPVYGSHLLSSQPPYTNIAVYLYTAATSQLRQIITGPQVAVCLGKVSQHHDFSSKSAQCLKHNL